jgi:4-amino-4-deoxy-L-arabinose transferase-like glycosyltransferase
MATTEPQNMELVTETPGKRPPRIAWVDFAILAALLVAFVLPRIVALGNFVTADEPTWGKRAANFYYALMDGDYTNTYQDGHPGVTTMWAGAIAYHLKFPEYQRVGQVALGDTKLLQLFQKHGPNPLELLATARLNIVIANVLALVASFFFARRLLGRWLAVLGFLLIAFDPLYVAHSRFLHTNGMLASFMFLSILAYLDYLQFHKRLSLMVSGIAAGLSFITITPGFNLIPVVFVLTLLNLGQYGSSPRHWKLKEWFGHLVVPLLVWGLVSLAVIFVIWPSMWVRPLGTLLDIARYTLNAAGGTDGGAQFVDAYQALDDQGSRYLYFYPLTYLWRSTPVTLFGLILAAIALLRPSSAHNLSLSVRRNLWLLLAYVAMYTLIMSLGSKKFDRYFLPAFLPLDLVAAAGWYALANWLEARYPRVKKYFLNYALLAGVVAIQLAATIRTAPYYLTYYNPLWGGIRKAPQVMTVGWGEGLNQAAIYLRSKPGFCDQRIISWYTLAYNWYSSSFGCEAQPVEFRADTSLEDYLNNYDYAVIYINQKQRNFPPQLLEYLKNQTPEKTIYIDGVDYVDIYRLTPPAEGSS